VDVVIQQTRHHFGFGAALSDWVLNEPKYAAYFTNHFEWAVFENETKWSEIEPYKDAASYATADAMYNFCISNNIRMRGHCIYWSVRQYIQEWVQDLAVTPDTLRHYMSNHLDNTVFRYREHFEHWDVNNEMLHGNFYSNIYGASIRPWMFERAHAVDPDAQLFVNDYGVLSYSDTATYVQQISGLMADGAPIHGIGAQCHMWELNPYLLLSRLDTLGELDLPVWCTEFDISQADETDRARQLEIFYRAAFSHPAVEGILMWGFWASNHWRGADAALVDADWSTNAAGEKYEALMESWTTETTLTANASGRIAFRGFHGSYILMASTNGGGSSFSLPLELPPAERACCRVIMLPHQDADHDGMPDAWEQVHGLNTGQNDAVADPDGDGVGNLNEYWAATIPTDCLSLPKLDMHTVNVQTNYLSYLADDTRFYQVEYRTNLISGSWLALSDVRRGSGGPVTLTNRQPAVRGYYRLRIQNGID
jgi:GH35 family endo-1,4-beta-xylanase